MGTRLATVAPDLSDRLRSLADDQVRNEVQVAVRAALAHTGLTDPTVVEALDHDGGEAGADRRAAVEAIAARLDEEAWGIQEREGDTPTYVAVFQQARAASAVFFSLHPEVRAFADDALYEAQAALGSVDSLRTHMTL